VFPFVRNGRSRLPTTAVAPGENGNDLPQRTTGRIACRTFPGHARILESPPTVKSRGTHLTISPLLGLLPRVIIASPPSLPLLPAINERDRDRSPD